jgi:cytochrome c553
MNLALRCGVLAAACMLPFTMAAQNAGVPLWAYPVLPAGTPAPPAAQDDGSAKHVPDSDLALTIKQIRDLFNPPDWHPNDHPAMPEVVMHGRKPDVRACGYCHLPNGQGRPENASLVGLPAGYIVQQMADYRNGLRKSSEPRMGPPALMLVIGKASNEEESKAAAEYFAGLKPKKWIRVVEQKMVPKTRIAGGMMVPVEGGGMEPIGNRIIEMPEDLERTELRDSLSGFVAYAPPGSIKKGEALATTGGGKTIKCSICHGTNLKGLGNVPSIAGRSPSYLIRQLCDIQAGNRNGPWTQLMKEAVARLTADDMVSLGAYLASREP